MSATLRPLVMEWWPVIQPQSAVGAKNLLPADIAVLILLTYSKPVSAIYSDFGDSGFQLAITNRGAVAWPTGSFTRKRLLSEAGVTRKPPALRRRGPETGFWEMPNGFCCRVFHLGPGNCSWALLCPLETILGIKFGGFLSSYSFSATANLGLLGISDVPSARSGRRYEKV